jgi:predicted transposase YbfD/YdcC
VAIDGKTSRRSHNRKTGQKALHLVSAFATNTRLVLGQEAVDEKSNEITAIPALVERLDLERALVSIDAMGCNSNIAQSILDAKADYLLAVKDNQPTLQADIKSYFQAAPSNEVERIETVGKEHGRIEVRTHTVSHVVDWIDPQRCYPGAPRLTACQERTRSESSEPLAGRPRRSRTAKASRISRYAEKSRCAREWGGWGRLSVDGSGHDNPNRSEDPWGMWRHLVAARNRARTDRTQCGANEEVTRRAKDGRKPGRCPANAGSRLKLDAVLGRPRLKGPAFQPYRGHPCPRDPILLAASPQRAPPEDSHMTGTVDDRAPQGRRGDPKYLLEILGPRQC